MDDWSIRKGRWPWSWSIHSWSCSRCPFVVEGGSDSAIAWDRRHHLEDHTNEDLAEVRRFDYK